MDKAVAPRNGRVTAASRRTSTRLNPKAKQHQTEVNDRIQRRLEELEGVMGKLKTQVNFPNAEAEATAQASATEELVKKEAELRKLKEVELVTVSSEFKSQLETIEGQHQLILKQKETQFKQQLAIQKEDLQQTVTEYESKLNDVKVAHKVELRKIEALSSESVRVSEELQIQVKEQQSNLEDRDAIIAAHLQTLQQNSERIEELVEEGRVQEKTHLEEVEAVKANLLLLTEKLTVANEQLTQEQSTVASQSMEIAEMKAQIEAGQKELEEVRERLTEEIRTNEEAYQQTIKETTDDFKQQLQSLTVSLRKSEDEREMVEAKLAEVERVLEGREEHIQYLEDKAKVDESLRRKMHNQIQELKGNIRVICRVRPFLGTETAGEHEYEFPKTNPQQMILKNNGPAENLSRRRGGPATNTNSFTFDRCFGPDCRQQEVFEEISHLVQSSLDGYNCCIFAYGQTGSGKTYTMEGPPLAEQTPENAGMIQRAVTQVFAHKQLLESQGWTYSLTASFLEIYNETLRDLLVPAKSVPTDIKYDIKHLRNGHTSVTNMTVVPVTSPESVHSLLTSASPNRSTASTKMNDRSSRSHSVFQIGIEGSNSETGEKIRGLLNLIDLAGSERLGSSGAEGATKKETIAINSSLSNLSNCIQSLANKSKHVPYRNSKLTYLLQNSLGGNSKTLMFVNVSPAECNVKESVNSLRFAAKVNACDIGTAKKTGKVRL
eukprot:TRINITY_DN1490_c0_g2_i2.p1 TRINITY_DN1490_c0_g2~~TRINITY_DN1490_c0_g2_i2.p1  ORF type:complete len:720 (-),score=204.42 TRINITY_DN1490_c0_g2_i2:72-2231(-)